MQGFVLDNTTSKPSLGGLQEVTTLNTLELIEGRIDEHDLRTLVWNNTGLTYLKLVTCGVTLEMVLRVSMNSYPQHYPHQF